MGAVTAKDIPEEQRMLTECWEFYKRHYYAEEGDEFWMELVAEAKVIVAKYPGRGNLARKHLLAYIDEIEERWKKAHEFSFEVSGQQVGHCRKIGGAYPTSS